MSKDKKVEEVCPPPPALPTELEGVLRFCGDADPKLVKKDWKPRYCVLRKGHLALYDKPAKPEDPNRPFSEVVLKDCIIGQTTVKECCFAIQSAGSTALFQAKDAEERRQWLDELRSCIVSDAPAPSNPLTTSSGSRLGESTSKIATPPQPIENSAVTAAKESPPAATPSPPGQSWRGGVQVLPPMPARTGFLRATGSGSTRGESPNPIGERKAAPAPPTELSASPSQPKLRSISPKPSGAVPAVPTEKASNDSAAEKASTDTVPSPTAATPKGRPLSPRPSLPGPAKPAAPEAQPTRNTVAEKPLTSSGSDLRTSSASQIFVPPFPTTPAPSLSALSTSSPSGSIIGRRAAFSDPAPAAIPRDAASLLEALQQAAPNFAHTAETLNELQQRIAALNVRTRLEAALANTDVAFLSTVYIDLNNALNTLEGPLRSLYLLLPMPAPKEEKPKDDKPKSLTAELESDPEFKEMMGRDMRPRNVTLRPLKAMLNEFDIATTEEELTSPRKDEAKPPADPAAAGDAKIEAEQLIAEMMSSSLMPGLAKKPLLKPSPSSPAVLRGLPKPVAAPVKPPARPLPVAKSGSSVSLGGSAKAVSRPQVKDDLLDELEKEELLSPKGGK